jgi:hypothetical protein
MTSKIPIIKTVKIGPIENSDCEYWYTIEDKRIDVDFECGGYTISCWTKHHGDIEENRVNYICTDSIEELLTIADAIYKFTGES